MKNLKNSKIFWLTVAGAVLFLFCTYWKYAAAFISLIIGALAPLALGAVVAYIINLPLKGFERIWKKSNKKTDVLRRPVCILLSFLTVAAIISIIVSTILPELQSCIMLLVREIPPFITDAYEWAKNTLNLSSESAAQLETLLKGINWETAVKQAVEVITSGMGSALNAVFSFLWSIVSVIFMLFVAVVFAVYLLANKEKLASQSRRVINAYTKEPFYSRFYKILRLLDNSFSKFIVGQCVEAVILGSLVFFGMLIFRLPYYSMISVLIGFTALIPIAGAYIGAAVGAFMIFTVSPVKALVFLIFLIVLQQLEGNIIYPRVVGRSIGLPGIWVLAAITVGGGVMGIPGMLIAVPLVSTAYTLVGQNIKKKNSPNTPDGQA